ncbi:MAG: ROK family protein [Clostridia bacterium]|nr:ROK family protein [Clostridia bacterium]MBQ4608808.1 ROK family protein [Clostridia bacterium]MBQ6858317.1 ROK family protein [Clostridia bacterium]MBQ7051713.1 ROK family protein [Clostridia bacterium]
MLIAALEAGGDNMICSIGTLQGGVMQRAAIRTGEPDATLDEAAAFFSKFGVKALGVGAFGPLDLNPESATYGYITNTPKKDWAYYPLMPELKKRLNIPMALDTAVNAAALGESAAGAGRGLRSMLYVSVGAGVGGGFVVDGRPLHGLVHPEMGHMPVAPLQDDPMPEGVCPYHPHCLEGMASGPAMEKRWGLSPQLMTQDHPAWALEAGYLAQLCANAIVMLSPERIVMGGSVMQNTQLFPLIRKKTLDLLGGYVCSGAMTPQGMEEYIAAPALGLNACVTGALLLGARAAQAEA